LTADTPAPPGLSTESKARWRELLAAYQFSAAELITLAEHLRCRDRAMKFSLARQHDLAIRWEQQSHRWWRGLKFGAAAAARQPHRPGDRDWSARRKQSAGGI
jgi:hypothetical protein